MDQNEFERLTTGEMLLIERRRRNLTQSEMAAAFDLTRNQYGECERDSETAPKGIVVPAAITELEEYEKCLLRRRRLGMKQREVAKAMKVTRFWLNQMETGKVPCASLKEFWEL